MSVLISIVYVLRSFRVPGTWNDTDSMAQISNTKVRDLPRDFESGDYNFRNAVLFAISQKADLNVSDEVRRQSGMY